MKHFYFIIALLCLGLNASADSYGVTTGTASQSIGGMKTFTDIIHLGPGAMLEGVRGTLVNPDGDLVGSRIVGAVPYATSSGNATLSGSSSVSGSSVVSGSAATSGSAAVAGSLTGAGNIVSHNVSEFATAAQGVKADTALQPDSRAFKKTAAALATGVARVVTFGDSFIETAQGAWEAEFSSRFGIAGYTLGGNLSFGSLSGGATSSLASLDFTKWINGIYCTVPAGGSVQYGLVGATVGVRSNTWKVFHLKGPGAGTFKIEAVMPDNSLVTLVASVDASNASTIGAVASGTFATLVKHKLKITGLSGTCHVVGTEMVDSTATGVIMGSVAQGGIDLVAMTTPAEIVTPIMASAAPDLVLYSMADSATATTTYLPGWIAKTQAAKEADWLIIGCHPFDPTVTHDGAATANDATVREINTTLKGIAVQSGFAFYDPFEIFGGYTNTSPVLDEFKIHLTSIGNIIKANRAMQITGLGELGRLVTGNYHVTSFNRLAVPGNSNYRSRIGGITEFGRNDPFGNASGWITINDSNVSGTPDYTTQFTFANESKVLAAKINNVPCLQLQQLRALGSAVLLDNMQLVVGSGANPPSILGGSSAPGATNTYGQAHSEGSLYFARDTGWASIRNGAAWRYLATDSRTAVASGAYTATVSDDLIAVTGTTGATITLPSAASCRAGHSLTIKDEGGAAGTTAIAISGTVDGIVNPTIATDYGILRLYSNGTGWFGR